MWPSECLKSAMISTFFRYVWRAAWFPGYRRSLKLEQMERRLAEWNHAEYVYRGQG